MGSYTALLERYMDGFRNGDHAAILSCLTDDVVWHIHGVRSTHGSDEFMAEVTNPSFEGLPVLTVERLIESGDVVVMTGSGSGRLWDGGPFNFEFNDIFTFRDGLIAQLDSYLVQV
jgi:ketosteroid isomerase-like protein